MELFTLKYAKKKHRMSLVSLHPAGSGARTDPKKYFVSCGAYKPETGSGRMTFKGLALEGVVPVVELVRWARRKGFLKWSRRGGRLNGSRAHGGSARKVSRAAGGGSQRQVAG